MCIQTCPYDPEPSEGKQPAVKAPKKESEQRLPRKLLRTSSLMVGELVPSRLNKQTWGSATGTELTTTADPGLTSGGLL